MDDDLVLNLAINDNVSAKSSSGKKGGRWTERLKVKRTLKRKARPDDQSTRPLKLSNISEDGPPQKKARMERPPVKRPLPTISIQSTAAKQTSSTQPTHPSKPSQIISSLFSYNPKVEAPVPRTVDLKHTAPSNAPLDSSTFSGLGLNGLLISHLASKMDIHKPTAIQRASLPVLLSTSPEKSLRDVFLQSQTGSGKTLSYLLPIIQDLLPLSSLSYIDRSIGTLAIIIAPTRELAKQISDVLEAILKMRLRHEDSSTVEPDTTTQLTRWLVSGLLVGGATRTHEKARLRKGLPILVSTPGRLLDHLQNTSSFNVGKCRWLVLDEADQLMELGFEETITGIIQGLDGRRRLAKQAMEEGKSMEVNGWDWERTRRTVLCSATIREDVQKLAGAALVNPLMVKATEVDKTDVIPKSESSLVAGSTPESFTPPSQLSQKYVTVPLKLRLVALVALLRQLVAETQVRKGAKIIVFLSCTDSVDFHWNLLGSSSMEDANPEPSNDGSENSDNSDNEESMKTSSNSLSEKVDAQSPLLPGVTIYRLHGSLPNNLRLAALKGFSGVPNKNKPSQELSSILFCTSVASRGLDLPLVRAVIQYDLPTEGGVTEYVHRVGRTARAGKGGEAWSFVSPSEVAWVKWVEDKMQGEEKKDGSSKISLSGVSVENLLRLGFGGAGSEYEQRATEVQLAFERWVLRNKDSTLLARKAFLSHMRAYATHPSVEKHIFHIRNLHMGHLAKAFALREAPKSVKVAHSSPKKNEVKTKAHRTSNKTKAEGLKEWERGHSGDAEKRMQAIVRAQGRLTKQGGVMASIGASEFQISSGYDLERLVGK